MKMIVLGGFGSDAGYWSFENGRWVHHGGWEINQLADVSRSLSILGEAARLKTPGLADSVSKELSVSVEKALTAHLGKQLGGEASVVIVNVAH
ncbi:hypothetical protein [Phenylobacterium sp.]|uniref:hypothetical protein n=1 Tax=Phenylobacterium sp. TaxID=1871053 RepID=UPI003568F69B